MTKWGIGYNDALTEKGRDSRENRAKLSIETSLKHLGTDYVDVYLIHWPDRRIPFDEPMRAMEDIVQEGKARFVGVSNFRAEEIEACMQTRRVDVGQYGYHLFDRRTEREIFPTHEKHGIGIELYHLALVWVLSNPVLSVALVGARTPAEVEANMGALEVEFSADQLSAIQGVFDRYHVDTQPDIWVE